MSFQSSSFQFLEMELDGRSPPSQEEAAGPGMLQLLPYDLIDVIIERLPLSDFIRFGAVCVEWQHIQKEYRRRFSLYPPPPRLHSLPWFIAQFPLIRLETATSCMSPFESSSRSYSIETPNLSADMTSSTCNYDETMPNSRRRRLFVPFLVGPFGSSHGWLVVAQLVRLNFDFHEELFFLVNPVSGKTFKLPKTPPIATSYDNRTRTCAVLSPPPYYVLFRIRARQHLLYLFRHNDNAWTVINLTNYQLILKPEATTTVNGVLYYLSSSWELLAVNASYNNPTPTIEKIEMDMTHLPVQPQQANNYFPFLVESNGDILLVIRFYVNYNIQNTTGFAVLKANFKNKMWIKMETSLGLGLGLGLGDRALFMDTYNTCSVSAVGVGNGIRGNCIYYLIRGYDLCWKVFDLNTGKADDAANCYISNPLFRQHFMILPSLC